MEFRCLRAHIRQMDQEWIRDGKGGGRYSNKHVDKLVALIRDYNIKDAAFIDEVCMCVYVCVCLCVCLCVCVYVPS
jgi:hypothetical protein